MGKNYNFVCGILSIFLFMIPLRVWGVTAEEIYPLQKALVNLEGPCNLMLVGSGTMKWPGRKLTILLGHYISHCGEEETREYWEGIHIEVMDPINEPTYRMVRRGREITSLSFDPIFKRGRRLELLLNDGIRHSDYPWYLILWAAHFRYDFSYTATTQEKDNEYTIEGERLPGSESPYAFITLTLGREYGIEVINKIVFLNEEKKEELTQTIEYMEIINVPGHVAPRKVQIGNTSLEFQKWSGKPVKSWIFSIDHNQLGQQHLPSP